jgi:hypothetical protein
VTITVFYYLLSSMFDYLIDLLSTDGVIKSLAF